MQNALTVCGINHNTAPIEIRELLAVSEPVLASVLQQVRKHTGIDELVLLSTCNRTEVYSSNENAENVLHWLAAKNTVAPERLKPYLYSYQNSAAVRHLLRVASGIDSMVTGEVQILGQLKQAFLLANEHRTVGSQLQRLFQYTFSAVKTIRSETQISTNAVSIGYCAIQLAKHLFTNLSQTRALLIGAGQTIELLARYLHSHAVSDICVVNRSLAKAEKIAATYNIKACSLEHISTLLPHYDLIFSATHSPLPIIGKGLVEQALKQRRYKPFFMIDLAVPRDIEAQVGQLSDVYLYTVDDLQHVINSNLQNRRSAAKEAEQLIDLHVEEYVRWQNSLSAVKTIRKLREQIDKHQSTEISRALKKLTHGQPAEEVLSELAHRLTNKISHTPIIKLREAGLNGDWETLALAEWLLMEHQDA